VKASLESFAWGRTFQDGHALIATSGVSVVRLAIKERKVTPLPPFPDPKNLLRTDGNSFFDHWVIVTHTQGVQAIDLERLPYAPIETEKTALGYPFEKTMSTCMSTNASYVDIGATLSIVTSSASSSVSASSSASPSASSSDSSWTFQPLDQPSHGRHIFCDGSGAVIADWHPLSLERCDDSTCTPMPGRVSGSSWDMFGADVEHVWQLDNSKPYLIVRVWPHAHPDQMRSTALVVGQELSRRSWGLRQPSALWVLKDRAFVLLETKRNKAVVISVATDGGAKVVSAK